MQSIALHFTVTKGCLAEQPGAFRCTWADGVLCAEVWYDFSDKPLRLTAPARPGDAARIVLLPYRIELYVNRVLCDEEWPCGNLLLQPDMLPEAFRVQPYRPDEKPQPAVLRTFRGAQGWQPEPNVFVGDCMPYVCGGRYHVLYLKDRHRHASKWGRGAHQWAHISTADFDLWQEHPLAVEIDDPAEGSICTGSHIERGGEQLLFYTVRTCDGSPAPVRRSVSRDGFHFEKDRSFSFTLSARYTAASARDPKVVRAADGLYHMLVTTSLAEEGRGCLAHLTSPDLDKWTEQEPLYIAPEGGSEPECPDYVAYCGRYYLIFSLHGVGQYLLSDAPFSGFRSPRDPVIPCSSVPKCAPWKGELVFAGFEGGGRYAGTLTFRTARAGEDGELVFSD